MLTEGDAKAVLEKALEMTDADEAEASIGGGNFALTRFANNIIHQNVAEEKYELSIRVAYGKRTARATTSSLEDEFIRRAVISAQEMAKQSSPLPDLLSPAEPSGRPRKDCYRESTARAEARARASMAKAVIDKCDEQGLSAAGIASTAEGSFGEYGEIPPFAIMNTNSLFVYQRLTKAAFSTTVHADGSSGWAAATSDDVRRVDAEALADRAVDKAIKGRDPVPLEPGRYTVVLEPEAVANLLWFLTEGFGALAVSEGRSFLSGKMGEPIVGENVTIRDDVYHRLHIGAPFDCEGVRKKTVDLINSGVSCGVVHDRATAKAAGTEPTGHGLPVPNTEGPIPSHLVMESESKSESLDKLISSVDRGVLVTRFWYTRVVDPIKVIITGMTRDGTFLIENGAVSRPVMNMRFNQNVLDMLKNVDGMTEQTMASDLVVPGIRAHQFNFTSGTSF
jgi:PmbA protein